MDTEAARAVIAVGADPRAGAVPREDGYGEYGRCQRATVVVDTDKRRHPARGEVAPERLIQLSSACLCHEPRGYRMLHAEIYKLAEHPGALGYRGPFGLYE